MTLEFNDILLYTDAKGKGKVKVKVKVEVIYQDESFWLWVQTDHRVAVRL